MEKDKFSENYFEFGKYAKKYLRFVSAAFFVSGMICAGLYLNAFGFVDRVNSYILADEFLRSMIRSTAAAAMLTMLIDLMEKKYGDL